MKRSVKLTGAVLMLILACNFSLHAQRAMRGTMDSTHMNMMKVKPDTVHRHIQGERMTPYGMRHGVGPDSFASAGRGMRGFDRGSRGPGDYMLESIPNVTEKQKKDITELKQKQQDDTKKLRDEMSAKMQSIRDSYNKSIMSIFTDEQKKFIESGKPEAAASPAKTK